MSDSECESATEYTSLMDAHVAPVRTEPVADRRRKPQNSLEPRGDIAEDDVNIAPYFVMLVELWMWLVLFYHPHPWQFYLVNFFTTKLIPERVEPCCNFHNVKVNWHLYKSHLDDIGLHRLPFIIIRAWCCAVCTVCIVILIVNHTLCQSYPISQCLKVNI